MRISEQPKSASDRRGRRQLARGSTMAEEVEQSAVGLVEARPRSRPAGDDPCLESDQSARKTCGARREFPPRRRLGREAEQARRGSPGRKDGMPTRRKLQERRRVRATGPQRRATAVVVDALAQSLEAPASSHAGERLRNGREREPGEVVDPPEAIAAALNSGPDEPGDLWRGWRPLAGDHRRNHRGGTE